jgi:methionyl-tRNA synthetase
MEISFDDFAKLDIKIGTIVEVEPVPDTDKLLKLKVDVGEESHRQIISGIKHFFDDWTELKGKQAPFLTNLEPRTIRGLESQGMILAGGDEDTFTLLSPDKTVSPGTRIS